MDMEAQTDTLFNKIHNTLSELECSYDDLDRLLEPLLSRPLNELASSLGPIDRARLYSLYGFTLNSLISCLLITYTYVYVYIFFSYFLFYPYILTVYTCFVVFLELKGQDSKIKILEEQCVNSKQIFLGS